MVLEPGRQSAPARRTVGTTVIPIAALRENEAMPPLPDDDPVPRLGDGGRALSDLAQRERFLDAWAQSLADGTARRLVLSKPCDKGDDVQRVAARPLRLRGEACVSFVWHHRTRDITKNESLDDARETVAALVGTRFAHAHLLAGDDELQLMTSRKGRFTMHRHRVRQGDAAAAAAQAALADDEAGVDPGGDTDLHDRLKRRWIEQDAPFLVALGVTDERHRLVPAMARKWKQINKFVEVTSHALEAAGCLEAGRPLRIVDFGAGLGYLTFALHDWLRRQPAIDAGMLDVVGVELRAELVRQCSDAVAACALSGLRFEAGDIASFAAAPMDVMIALHACDTATDLAIHAGIRAGASVIVCSPCCHKQLRPQMQAPAPLRGLLHHGIHLGQEAEMLTDALRALLLEANGYDAQVFEFVSLEHTSKNKMILAVKRRLAADSSDAMRRRERALAQVDELKRFYGVREQCLESLLAD
jgi:hypothetical protein